MRYIELTDELKKQALDSLREQLNAGRFSDNKISFSFDLTNNETLEENDKVILNVRPTAWLKMWALVQTESKEIGWHGLITRHSDKIFELSDILMYPQVTSAVTVVTDDVEYGNWLHKEVSDEDINHLRLHGHSHVNMSTSPSGVDTTWYNQILQTLSKDDFYIFMILNKREDYFIEIYDLKNNTIYEKKDIIINVIMEDNNYLNNWVTKQKNKYLKEEKVERLPSLDDIRKFDDENVYDFKSNFKELLLNFTKGDFNDPALVQGVIMELSQKAPYTGYFGLGWQKWNFLTKEEKIEVAQEYYLSDKSKKKSKYGRGSYYDRYGGLYD